MQLTKHQATPAVTEIVTVTEAKPATFDLTGLSEAQLAVLIMSVARTCGDNKQSYALYEGMRKLAGLPNNFFFDLNKSPSNGGQNLEITKTHVDNCVAEFGKEF